MAARMGLLPKPTLQEYMEENLLPTPNAQDYKKRGPKSKQKSVENFIRDGLVQTSEPDIEQLVRKMGGVILKTPAARDWKGANGPHGFETLPGQIQNMEKELNIHKKNGQNSHLSPLFVEEMMGYPLTWLVSPFLSQAGEKRQ